MQNLYISGSIEDMSYFGNTLKELLDRKGMKAVRLAELAGISQPTVSRYINGDQVWVSEEDVTRLAVAISDDPKEQAELIRGRLLDVKVGPGSELVRVEVVGSSSGKTPSQECVLRLPDDLEAALLIICENAIRDADVRDVVLGLANLLEGDANRKSHLSQISLSKTKRAGTKRASRIGRKLDRDIAEAVKPPAPPRR